MCRTSALYKATSMEMRERGINYLSMVTGEVGSMLGKFNKPAYLTLMPRWKKTWKRNTWRYNSVLDPKGKKFQIEFGSWAHPGAIPHLCLPLEWVFPEDYKLGFYLEESVEGIRAQAVSPGFCANVHVSRRRWRNVSGFWVWTRNVFRRGYEGDEELEIFLARILDIGVILSMWVSIALSLSLSFCPLFLLHQSFAAPGHNVASSHDCAVHGSEEEQSTNSQSLQTRHFFATSLLILIWVVLERIFWNS